MIEFYAIFDGMTSEVLKPDDGLLENIKRVYLLNFDSMKQNFIYTDDELLQSEIQSILTKLACGDRKRYSIYKTKNISQTTGKKVYKMLFDLGIIEQEISREVPLRFAGQQLKKEFRDYKRDNKIHFTQEATRFWFTFVVPNEKLIEEGKIEKVLENIDEHLEKYVSLTFELLSGELLEKILPLHSIVSSGSYWSKNQEIDLLVYTKDERVIVGEVKWKNRKICKNVLNSLYRKAERANLGVTHFALFSKSGFSKEVEAIKDTNVMLFGLEDFKRLYYDR